MKSPRSLPFWTKVGLAFPVLFLNGWLFVIVVEYFRSLITVGIIATLLAFVLSYFVEWLTRLRMKRDRAVWATIALTLILLGIAAVTIVPLIIEQLNQLVERLPSWIESGTQQLQTLNQQAASRKLPIDFTGISTHLREKLAEQLQSLTGEILSFVLGTVDSLVNLLLTMVLTFYLLLHGDELWEGIWQWLPQSWNLEVRPLLRQNFRNYYLGQASLAGLIGISISLAFLVLKVPFGVLFGLGVGILALFPFGAFLGICLVSLLVALTSFWLGVRVLIVAIIIEQIMENVIAPRLLGGFTGLNPVWILVALLIGAKIGGLVGLLIAVPMAGFIKSTATVWQRERRTHSVGEKVDLEQA